MRTTLGYAFVIAVLSAPLLGAPTLVTPDIAADSEIQSALAAIEKASSVEDGRRRIDEMARMADGEPDRLIGQLLWYSSQHAGEPRARVIVGRVMKRADVSKDAAVRALVNHLDDGNAGIRRDARELLKGYEDRSATRPPDFSTYREIIAEDVRAGREPRASLVELMYQSDAATALPTMVRAYQLREPGEIKPILWAEHVVSDFLWRRRFGFVAANAVDAAAVQQIEMMSRHPRWWARLYAAEIVRVHPELGAAGVADRLAGDGNALVRSAGLAAKAKQTNSNSK